MPDDKPRWNSDLTASTRYKLESDRGEVASWLILAAGLAAAAVLAAGVMRNTIGALASNVAEAAAGQPATGGQGTSPQTLTEDTGSTDPVGGAPVFGPPLPDNDVTDNWFFAGEHTYSHVSPSTDADYETLIGAINERGVHPNQTDPFVPGEAYTGDVNLPGPFGVDNVTTTAIFDQNGNQIGVRNETEENHALHPGWVERTIVQDENGALHIQTTGGGSGALGGPNVWFDESVWGGVDNRVLDGLP